MEELFLEWVRENRLFIEKLKSEGYIREGQVERIDRALKILDE